MGIVIDRRPADVERDARRVLRLENLLFSSERIVEFEGHIGFSSAARLHLDG